MEQVEMTNEDIVQRLRAKPPSLGFEEYDPTYDARQEAASKIEALEAEARMLVAREATQANRAEAAEAEAAKLKEALTEIATHWANSYDHKYANTPMYEGPYGIGVTDGHRACTIIARRALGEGK